MSTVFSVVIEEGSSAKYTATLKDQDGQVVAGSALGSALLTLYDQGSGAIVNTRDGQNVLNANDVTIDEGGVVTWDVRPEDTATLDQSVSYQKRVALWEFNWNAGAKRLRHQIIFTVQNLAKVP